MPPSKKMETSTLSVGLAWAMPSCSAAIGSLVAP